MADADPEALEKPSAEGVVLDEPGEPRAAAG
jgi:hypothetical protein